MFGQMDGDRAGVSGGPSGQVDQVMADSGRPGPQDVLPVADLVDGRDPRRGATGAAKPGSTTVAWLRQLAPNHRHTRLIRLMKLASGRR